MFLHFLGLSTSWRGVISQVTALQLHNSNTLHFYLLYQRLSSDPHAWLICTNPRRTKPMAGAVSALFLLDIKGRVLVWRDYRGDVSVVQTERFFTKLIEKEVRDIFTLLIYIWVRFSSIWILCVLNLEFWMLPWSVVSMLHRCWIWEWLCIDLWFLIGRSAIAKSSRVW